MITDTETLDIIRTGDFERILEHLQGLRDVDLRKALSDDFLALANLLKTDQYKLYDADFNILPWWQEQEWRAKMVMEHCNPDAWVNWPDEYLEFLFSKVVVGFDHPVDLNKLLDVAYLMPNLEYLILSQQSPNAGTLHLRNLDQLKDLECTKSGIIDISWNLDALPHLRRIDLAHNQLSSIPEAWSALHLEEIDLSDNSIEILPDSLFSLPTLKSLHLANNKLKTIPHSSEELQKKWEFLTLDGNQIEDISFLESLQSIAWLDMRRNMITVFPSRLPNIARIALDSDHWNHLAPILPPGLGSIWISQGKSLLLLNQIGPAVETVWGLSMIKLEIESSFDLRRFSRLQALHLESVGGLSELPQGLFDLQQLQTISFLDCQIESLDGPWSNLKSLQSVTFNSCGIVDIPQSFFSLSREVEVDLEANHIPKGQKAKLKRHFKDLNI